MFLNISTGGPSTSVRAESLVCYLSPSHRSLALTRSQPRMTRELRNINRIGIARLLVLLHQLRELSPLCDCGQQLRHTARPFSIRIAVHLLKQFLLAASLERQESV